MGKGIETKEWILQKSAELFNIRGYEGCSMNDIMAATGLQKGGIYNHFKNKDDLALEAFDYSFRAVIARFRNRLDKDKTNWDKINSMIDVLAGFYKKPVIIGGCPVFNTAMDSLNTHPLLRKKALDGLENLLKYLEIKISDGIENGEFRVIENPRKMASLILMTIEGGLVLSRIYENEEHVLIASDYVKTHLKERLF